MSKLGKRLMAAAALVAVGLLLLAPGPAIAQKDKKPKEEPKDSKKANPKDKSKEPTARDIEALARAATFNADKAAIAKNGMTMVTLTPVILPDALKLEELEAGKIVAKVEYKGFKVTEGTTHIFVAKVGQKWQLTEVQGDKIVHKIDTVQVAKMEAKGKPAASVKIESGTNADRRPYMNATTCIVLSAGPTSAYKVCFAWAMDPR